MRELADGVSEESAVGGRVRQTVFRQISVQTDWVQTEQCTDRLGADRSVYRQTGCRQSSLGQHSVGAAVFGCRGFLRDLVAVQ